MSLIESAGRIGATIVAMVQTRLELATVEVEEESQRFLRYLILALLALFLASIAIVLVAFFVILVFWDSYRLQAVIAMALLFFGGAGALGWRLAQEMRNKPPLLAQTLAELRKDFEFVRPPEASDGE